MSANARGCFPVRPFLRPSLVMSLHFSSSLRSPLSTFHPPLSSRLHSHPFSHLHLPLPDPVRPSVPLSLLPSFLNPSHAHQPQHPLFSSSMQHRRLFVREGGIFLYDWIYFYYTAASAARAPSSNRQHRRLSVRGLVCKVNYNYLFLYDCNILIIQQHRRLFVRASELSLDTVQWAPLKAISLSLSHPLSLARARAIPSSSPSPSPSLPSLSLPSSLPFSLLSSLFSLLSSFSLLSLFSLSSLSLHSLPISISL